jgi:ClpP class serine protease
VSYPRIGVVTHAVVHRSVHNLGDWTGVGYVPAFAGHYSAVSKIVVRLTADEIVVLCNCINETLDSLDDAELDGRVGADRQQARALLGLLSEKRADARRLAEAKA